MATLGRALHVNMTGVRVVPKVFGITEIDGVIHVEV